MDLRGIYGTLFLVLSNILLELIFTGVQIQNNCMLTFVVACNHIDFKNYWPENIQGIKLRNLCLPLGVGLCCSNTLAPKYCTLTKRLFGGKMTVGDFLN